MQGLKAGVRGLVGSVASCLLAAAWLSCGARTGLLEPDFDASGGRGGLVDSGPEDASGGGDTSRDAAPDSPVVTSCADAGSTYIYLITAQRQLLSFYPPMAEFALIGTVACPIAPRESPFSMAVDRAGVAYVLFDDGELFRVSTRDASCQATPFQVGQLGFQTFGMGFSTDQNALGETLYVDQIQSRTTGPSLGLGTIDVQTYQLGFIGTFDDPTNAGGELTGNGESQLYGYFFHTTGSGGTLTQLDRQSGKTISSVALPIGNAQSSLAFAFWGGQFYIFTSQLTNPTTVTRYSPSDGSPQVVADYAGTITGAGVSTCAPQH
ncbi:MAG TPA: hypothetical protein VHV51_11170 [Polyangiaceae bacterium]|nr:hypothetical protein [Polyangiaceae bacterium]